MFPFLIPRPQDQFFFFFFVVVKDFISFIIYLKGDTGLLKRLLQCWSSGGAARDSGRAEEHCSAEVTRQLSAHSSAEAG